MNMRYRPRGPPDPPGPHTQLTVRRKEGDMSTTTTSQHHSLTASASAALLIDAITAMGRAGQIPQTFFDNLRAILREQDAVREG